MQAADVDLAVVPRQGGSEALASSRTLGISLFASHEGFISYQDHEEFISYQDH